MLFFEAYNLLILDQLYPYHKIYFFQVRSPKMEQEQNVQTLENKNFKVVTAEHRHIIE